MPLFTVRKEYSWTFVIRADNEDTAERLADNLEISGGDLLCDGYADTVVELYDGPPCEAIDASE